MAAELYFESRISSGSELAEVDTSCVFIFIANPVSRKKGRSACYYRSARKYETSSSNSDEMKEVDSASTANARRTALSGCISLKEWDTDPIDYSESLLKRDTSFWIAAMTCRIEINSGYRICFCCEEPANSCSQLKSKLTSGSIQVERQSFFKYAPRTALLKMASTVNGRCNFIFRVVEASYVCIPLGRCTSSIWKFCW